MADFEWKDGGTGFISIDGTSLETACFGPTPEASPTLVLLHEGLGCVELWRDFPSRLAEVTGCGVLAYSRAGYGRSDPCLLPRPLDYMTREAMETLPRVLDCIGFQKGVLIGHSDGATIATIHAGMSGDLRVRGLVLMAPHFFAEDSGLEAIAKAKQAYEGGDLRDRLSKYHGDVDCAFRGWNDAWLDPGFREWNVAEAIDYLRVPVLAIQGREDPYGTLAQIEEIENRIYSPVDIELLEECGHAPHREKPDQMLGTVGDFVARLQRIEAESVSLS